MLDELLNKEDVCNFISEIKTNDRYFSKELKSFANRKITISREIALYIFYESLYKYHLLFDETYLFDEYLEQLEKLYKKVDNYDDIISGINKTLCKLLTIKLNIKDINQAQSRIDVITYIYEKYIVNGYYIHGFNTSYTKVIEEKGFDPENYENYYEKFSKLNKIFAKYNVINIIDKNFSKKSVDFTDDFLMSCYYSTYGPNFFSSFLKNEDYFGKRTKKDGYLIDDYNLTISHLKRFMSNNMFSEDDKKFILDLVKDEWDLLHREDKKISLLLVKRDRFKEENINLDDYLNRDDDLYDIADMILNSKKTRVVCDKHISNKDIKIITLDPYYTSEDKINELKEHEEEIKKYIREQENNEFMNTYGTASILVLTGTLFIILGVIITIIMLARGI